MMNLDTLSIPKVARSLRILGALQNPVFISSQSLLNAEDQVELMESVLSSSILDIEHRLHDNA